MPGPIRLFKYFTTDQLNAAIAACVQQMSSGAFTSLSGAQKSSSQEWLDLEVRLRALNYEQDIRNNVVRVQKVTQRVRPAQDNYRGF